MTLPSDRGFWRWHLVALAVYVAISIRFLDHGVSITRNIQGIGSDPTAFTWFLAWWPFAISHHLNPLYTHLVWQPAGVDLAWMTSVPLLSLIGLPVMLLSGPVLAFNVLIIAAPALAAWAAYALCLDVTRAPAASLIGGYLFGFSSYEMAQTLGHLNLSFTTFVPLLLLTILHRLRGDLSRLVFILSAGILIICEFLTSMEICAMMFIFGAIAWALALAYLPQWRAALRRLFTDLLATAPAVVILLSPFLFSMLTHYGAVRLPKDWPYSFSNDLLNLFIPTEINAFSFFPFTRITQNFSGNYTEQCGYIGLPLLAILLLFARQLWHFPLQRFLLVVWLCITLASFGPHLLIDGHFSRIILPWVLAVHVPLAGSALPARFAMFSSLVLAIIAAMWVADARPGRSREFRLALGGLACVAMLPRLHPWMNIPYSRFFQPGHVQAALGPHSQILILPFSINGPSSFWQEEAGFSFSQTGGYLGLPPAAMQDFPAVQELYGDYQGPGLRADFQAFCSETGTEFVVAGPGTPHNLLAMLNTLPWPHRQIDDATIFTVPPSHD
jgi:hypothetical protein